ncbi:hypothetical protein PR048_023925 [Dryococelus australis]|uniref:Uncharacterized protein n=1 Tax=Dryococelus australis TaxID=614101 RepID=A0ABQ9GVG8_9NEOP|nr:hypothetical protein PR048_023925 [Dryococelus australis]
MVIDTEETITEVRPDILRPFHQRSPDTMERYYSTTVTGRCQGKFVRRLGLIEPPTDWCPVRPIIYLRNITSERFRLWSSAHDPKETELALHFRLALFHMQCLAPGYHIRNPTSLMPRWQEVSKQATIGEVPGEHHGPCYVRFPLWQGFRVEVSDQLGDYLFFSELRTEASGMMHHWYPPIRQTASIFKQPVTVYKMQEGKVKTDFKHGTQEKPKQLFWEKRLEGLRACDADGTEFNMMELPRVLKPVGPHVSEETVLQSVATALHVSTQPVTGQTGSRSALEKNSGVFLNPDQPLMQAVSVADDDIKRQEERVQAARKKLQDALKKSLVLAV